MVALPLQKINQLLRGGNQQASPAPRPAAHYPNSPDGGGSASRRINDAGPLPFQQQPQTGGPASTASHAPRLDSALKIPHHRPTASDPSLSPPTKLGPPTKLDSRRRLASSNHPATPTPPPSLPSASTANDQECGSVRRTITPIAIDLRPRGSHHSPTGSGASGNPRLAGKHIPPSAPPITTSPSIHGRRGATVPRPAVEQQFPDRRWTTCPRPRHRSPPGTIARFARNFESPHQRQS